MGENIPSTLKLEKPSAQQNAQLTKAPKRDTASRKEQRSVKHAHLQEIRQLKKEKKAKNYVILSADQSITKNVISSHILMTKRKSSTKNYLIDLEESSLRNFYN